jgi:hypothetical protein
MHFLSPEEVMEKFGGTFSASEKRSFWKWREEGNQFLQPFTERIVRSQEMGFPRSADSVLRDWRESMPRPDNGYAEARFKRWPDYAKDCQRAVVLRSAEHYDKTHCIGFVTADGNVKHEVFFCKKSGRHWNRKLGHSKHHAWLDVEATRRNITTEERTTQERRSFFDLFPSACSREIKFKALHSLGGWACFLPTDEGMAIEGGFLPCPEPHRPKGVYLYQLRSKKYARSNEFNEMLWGWRYASPEITEEELKAASLFRPPTPEQERAEFYTRGQLEELATKLGVEAAVNANGWLQLTWKGTYGKYILGVVVDGKTHLKEEREVLDLFEKELNASTERAKADIAKLQEGLSGDLSLLEKIRSLR